MLWSKPTAGYDRCASYKVSICTEELIKAAQKAD